MKTDDRSSSPSLSKLSLVHAFVFGYVLWVVPLLVRWVLSSLSTRLVVYHALWIALLYALALPDAPARSW